MIPIDFEGTNMTFNKPEGWKDEECIDVRAFVGVDNAGHPFTLIGLQPSKEDIEAINAGRPIMVKLCMQGMVPIAVYTFDENYNANV